MFRFTIRDVLWVMVVVGLGCVIVVQHSKITSMHLEIDHQRERLLCANDNIDQLAKGWQQDRPDRIETENDYITVNGDKGRWSFGMPLRPR
jgi:hypothetical protein